MASKAYNPNFRPYGVGELPTLKGLTAQEERALDPHERIERVWAWLVRISAAFSERQKKHGIYVDPEDVLQELVATLLDRDGKWDPDRGKYMTFLAAVWRNVAARQCEVQKVVPAPHNALGTLRRLRKLKQVGLLDRQQQRTLRGLECIQGHILEFREPE